MKNTYFLQSERIGFSHWNRSNLMEAGMLWGDPAVTQYICASGVFSEEEVRDRLKREIEEQRQFSVQYWPIYHLTDGDLIGCCGLHSHGDPQQETIYELGFHLRPHYWHQGYALEAARAVIAYAFGELKADALFAGHNPNNKASERVLMKLGFQYTGDELYEPTGLFHPSYRLERIGEK